MNINPEFKNALLALYGDDPGRFQLKKRKIDYQQMIAAGALAESGENYYLFIYRDAFEKEDTYGGIYFLYKAFDFRNPIHIGFKGPDNLREHWNLYIGAAIYFLRKNLPDTMVILAAGTLRALYDELKDIVDTHTKEEVERKEKFDRYDFSLLNREIQVREMDLKIPVQKRATSLFNKELKLLKPRIDAKDVGLSQSNARLGLTLVISREKSGKVRFQPVIVPIKRDETYGAIKPAIRSQMDNYVFDHNLIPPLLNEFMAHLHDLSEKKEKNPVKIDMVSQVYFEPLVNLLMDMPDELTFCQFDTRDSTFYPLKKLKFSKVEVRFAPRPQGDMLCFFLLLTGIGGEEVDAGMDFHIIVKGENRVYLFFQAPEDKDQYYFAVPDGPEKFDRCFRFISQVGQFPPEEFKVIREALQETSSADLVIQPEPIPVYYLEFRPTPILRIRQRDSFRKMPDRIEVEFDYQSGVNTFLIENPHIRLVHNEKDNEFETLCLYLLKNDPLLNMQVEHGRHADISGHYFTFKDGDELNWLMESSPRYLRKGFRIYSERRQQYVGKTDSTVRIDINTGLKWLEFKPLLQNAATGEIFEIAYIDFYNSTITDKDGTLHIVKKEDSEKLIRLSHYAEHVGGLYRVPSRNYFLINFLYDRRVEILPQMKEQLLDARKLEDFKKIPNYKLSKNINGTLRKYQDAGFKWLRFLHDYNLCGCLADDMGLGKTLQTLALLQTLKDENRLDTSLLVVPVSAFTTWEAEIEKFTPGLTIYRHIGANRQSDVSVWANYDLVVTSYATLRNDIEIFKDFPFDYIILDESQAIKNLASQVAKAVKILKGNHRLALSGTPIENTSMELWSLFDFLMPGFLGTHQWFKNQWAVPVERYKDSRKAEVLKKMLYPFILRRKKEEVEKELPEKVEIVESLKMEEPQLKVYAATAAYYTEVVGNAIDEQGLERSSFKILEGMLRLRQICLFPLLVDEQYEGIPSVKFDHLTEMLEDILSEGHNVLVFSQFVRALAIIRDYFEKRGIRYTYIDGSTPLKTREKMVKDFQEQGDIPVFLLSLKAGGVSLNLTAADYVIIFDPWWNPAVEAQAIDRSHRIGQTRKVIVYRMVVKDTIEEKMLKLQDRKKELVDSLITSEAKVFKDLTREDIMSLFHFSEIKI
jgi:SNF2 family DNA or RNA helicase